MTRRPWYMRFETVGSISAIVIGVAALFVSWDQARVMRAQQHAIVMPAIQIDGFWGETADWIRFGVRVSNGGVGPAIIRDVTVLRSGERVDDVETLTGAFPDSVDYSWAALDGRIIAAGASVEPLGAQLPEPGTLSLEERAALAAEWQNWHLEICYCSVFDRCWITDTRDAARRMAPAGESCPENGADVFEQLGQPGRS